MLKYLILFLMIFSRLSAFVDEHQELEERYIETMALTFQGFSEQESEVIWPSFHLTDLPAVFHFHNGHVYAFGLNSHSSLWEKRFIQHSPILFCAQYPHSLPPLQPSFPLEGQRAFVFNLDHGNDTPYLPLLTFVHERFHIYQFQAFYKEKVVEAKLADYQNADVLAWIELEHRLLTSFLQAHAYEAKLQLLKDYVAISQKRRQSLHPHSIRWEDHQQKMEGLADYASVKTFQFFPYIPHFNAEEFLLKMRQKKNSAVVTTQDALKGRHYFVGAVLGWALDFCEIQEWKLRIEKEHVSLQDILEQALYMNEEERKVRCLKLQEVLDWSGIRKQIEQQIESEKRQKEEIVQIFMSQEGITVHMGTPSGHMSSGGSHKKIYQVDLKKALVADTSVAISEDQTWSLRFHGIPLIFEEQNGDRLFKLHPQTLLQLNDKPISLQEILQSEQKELHFFSLSLKHEHCELDSKRAGKICVEEGGVLFKFY